MKKLREKSSSCVAEKSLKLESMKKTGMLLKKVTELHDWIIKPLPDRRGLCIEGQKKGMEGFWHSTAVSDIAGPKTVVTITDSVYRLKGRINKLCTIDSGFSRDVAHAFSKGFPKNWKEVIEDFYRHLEESISVEAEYSTVKNYDVAKLKAVAKRNQAVTSKKVEEMNSFSASRSIWIPSGVVKQEMARDDVTVTRSGRMSLPPLATWTGQRYTKLPGSDTVQVVCRTKFAEKCLSQMASEILHLPKKTFKLMCNNKLSESFLLPKNTTPSICANKTVDLLQNFTHTSLTENTGFKMSKTSGKLIREKEIPPVRGSAKVATFEMEYREVKMAVTCESIGNELGENSEDEIIRRRRSAKKPLRYRDTDENNPPILARVCDGMQNSFSLKVCSLGMSNASLENTGSESEGPSTKTEMRKQQGMRRKKSLEVDKILHSDTDQCSEMRKQQGMRRKKSLEVDKILRSDTDQCSEMRKQQGMRGKKNLEANEILRSDTDQCSEMRKQQGMRRKKSLEVNKILHSDTEQCSEMRKQQGMRRKKNLEVDKILRSDTDQCSEVRKQQGMRRKKSLEVNKILHSDTDQCTSDLRLVGKHRVQEEEEDAPGKDWKCGVKTCDNGRVASPGKCSKRSSENKNICKSSSGRSMGEPGRRSTRAARTPRPKKLAHVSNGGQPTPETCDSCRPQNHVAVSCKLADDEKKQAQVTRKRRRKDFANEEVEEENDDTRERLRSSKRRKLTHDMVDGNTSWTEEEKSLLWRAVKHLDGASLEFWEEVSQVVGTRSEAECQHFYKQCLEDRLNKKAKNPPSRNLKQEKKKTGRRKGEPICGGKGTLKRKQDLRDFLDEQNDGYEDNLFDSTPFVQRKSLPSAFTGNIEQSDSEIFGANHNFFTPLPATNAFTTPRTALRVRMASAKKTPPYNQFLHSENTPVNRRRVDQYIKTFNERKKKAQCVQQMSPQVDQNVLEQSTLPFKSLFSSAVHPSIVVDSFDDDDDEDDNPYMYHWND